MSDLRLEQLKQWLESQLKHSNFEVTVASADASFRRYFRIAINGETFIAMDAPPEKEDCKPFIYAATEFGKLGLNVPKIIHSDLDQGFLLLNDFGTTQYLDVLNANTAEQLYGDAMHALVTLQKKSQGREDAFPPYNAALLAREMELFREWFLQKHLGLTLSADENQMLDDAFEVLSACALEQTRVWVHRDYHSRNLMRTEQDNPGILDFQDAVVGATTYDLVSLLRDCYIDWPQTQVEAWVEKFRVMLTENNVIKGVSADQYLHWFDLMGSQRHLKAIGIFARLNYRDNKPGYINDIPRTLGYVEQVCAKHAELHAFGHFIEQRVLPVFNRNTGHKK